MNKLAPFIVALILITMLFSTTDQALADNTVVITPSNMGDWSFHQFAPSGTGEIIDGPGTPPLGNGSARLTTNNNGGMSLQSAGYFNTRLDALTRLEYSSYRATSDLNNNRTVTLQLEMDYNIVDPDRSNQGWLVYEPYRTAGAGTVTVDTWYTWDALSGSWYATINLGSNRCTQSDPCTITQLLSWYPNAGIRHNGNLRFAAGASWNLPFTGYADALTIGVLGVNTTYNFELNDLPSVSAGGPYSGDEGADINLSASASDPDSDPLAYAWTYTPVPDIDAGAACSFADPAALSTTVSCTDAGEFTLTLTVNDGVNPPVASSTTLTLTGTKPSVAIASPSDGASFQEGQQVDVSANLSDADNDSLTCSVDWGDGVASEGLLSDGVCTASYAYISPGDYTITVTVSDDDGGSASDITGISVFNVSDNDGGSASEIAGISVFNDQPTADTGGPYSGDEGLAIPLNGSAADLNDDSLIYFWTYAAGKDTDPGTICTFVDAAAAVTNISCTDNGSFTLNLTVDDGLNPPIIASAPLSINNQAPSVTLTAPVDGIFYTKGETVNLSATFTDVGGNDTYTCEVAWGDGEITNGVVTGGVCTASHLYSAPGEFIIIVNVEDDDLQTGSDSITVRINAPNSSPTTEAGGSYNGGEGQAVELNGSAIDSDGDSLTVAWTYSLGEGVDPGTACLFGNPAAPVTSFLCTDHGEFSLTITVDDGHNPPVTDTTSINLENRPPVVVLDSLVGNPIRKIGEVIPLSASIADPSTNDIHVCQVNWGDGAVTDGVVSNGTCTVNHAYSVQGTYTILVTVIDDEGDSGTASASITITGEPKSGVAPVFMPLMNKNWNSNH